MQNSQAFQHQEDIGEEIRAACSETSDSAASIYNGNQSVTTGYVEPALVFESNLMIMGTVILLVMMILHVNACVRSFINVLL